MIYLYIYLGIGMVLTIYGREKWLRAFDSFSFTPFERMATVFCTMIFLLLFWLPYLAYGKIILKRNIF